ncbi:hypothetical protein [Kineococcus glutinatus]|uniref:Uncharacterized protein n=1 Tax=Kineococcus glutinatus TaxID=1070872 RepID=A0ABP9HY82_9ACTN
MSSPAHTPVVSGRAYPVTEVGGAAPSSLEEFAADTVLVLDGGYVVGGRGVRTGDEVAFYEKAPGGKDVRVWCVRQVRPGVFEAVHDARF